MEIEFDFESISALQSVCGQRNENLTFIERQRDVRIRNRGSRFTIEGNQQKVNEVLRLLHGLVDEANRGEIVSLESINMAMTDKSESTDIVTKDPAGDNGDYNNTENTIILRPRSGVMVKGRNPRQRQYLKQIKDHDICFGVGPAGTGKTYLAVAMAAQALIDQEVERILLVRPAVEAGERLGFLPGDIGQKVDPYLRPLYDALYEMLGFERVGRLMERGIIELAPLAYMRGRTLSHAYVILDEAQNTTVEQMKMFLTRIGMGSKAVITGDISQIDLPRGTLSGLKHAINILNDVDGIDMTHFKPQDVVRHPLVQRIVEAYEADDDDRSH